MKIVEYTLNRLAEPSTWRGLTGIATALGIALDPAQAAAITAAGIALIGLINVFKKDAKSADAAAQ